MHHQPPCAIPRRASRACARTQAHSQAQTRDAQTMTIQHNTRAARSTHAELPSRSIREASWCSSASVGGTAPDRARTSAYPGGMYNSACTCAHSTVNAHPQPRGAGGRAGRTTLGTSYRSALEINRLVQVMRQQHELEQEHTKPANTDTHIPSHRLRLLGSQAPSSVISKSSTLKDCAQDRQRGRERDTQTHS